MQRGTVGVLNVGAGDTRLTFDKSNPAERIRAARIVADMLRRGYALLVEVDDGKGGKTFQRAHEFREETCEYVIADFDPVTAAAADEAERAEASEEAGAAPVETSGEATQSRRSQEPAFKDRRKRAVEASGTRAIAVSRSAGG